MRRLSATVLIALSLVGGAAVAACSSSGRQFTVVLQGSDEALRLPVALSDETGLVTGIGSAPMDPTAAYDQPIARADPTDPNAFIVSWLGGACDNDASLTFRRLQGVYVVNVAVNGKFSFPGGCNASGILRDVRIATSSPIPVDSIVAAGRT